MSEAVKPKPPEHRKGRKLGRFEMFGSIASGGFASVHLGRTLGAGGFSKLVAIKRLHRQFAEDPEIAKMFLDEARVVARIQHPNVVPTLDFVEEDGELFMVMEYVEGATAGHLIHAVRGKNQRIPLDITLRIMAGTLRGLHAAHEAKDERGKNLGVIHRDVSPENILVGCDGYSRIIDFGVARALGRYHATRQGEIKGKLSYMTPEQVAGGSPLTRRSDIFSLSVVFWECLTNKKLFEGEHMAEIALKVSQQAIAAPSVHYRTLPRKYEEIVMRGLERDPAKRWETAEAMAEAIEDVGKLASAGRVGKWVKSIAKGRIERRTKQISLVELTPAGGSSLEPASSEGENSYRAATTHVLKVDKHEGEDEASKVIVADNEPPTSSLRGATPAPSSQDVLSQPGDSEPVAIHSEPKTVLSEPKVVLGEPKTLVSEPDAVTVAQERAAGAEPELSWPGQDDDEISISFPAGDRDSPTEIMLQPDVEPLPEPSAPTKPQPTAASLSVALSQDGAIADEPSASISVVVAKPKRGPAIAIGIGIALLAGFALFVMLQPSEKDAPIAPAAAPPPAAEPAAAATAAEAPSKAVMDVAEPDDEVEEAPPAKASSEPDADEPPSAAPAPNPVAARRAPPAPRPAARRAPTRRRPRPKPKPSSPEDKLFSRD